MAVGKAGQRLGQPGVRVDAGELAVLDERGDNCPVVAAFVGSCEQGVFAVEGKRADGTLDGVVVEIDPAIIEEAREAIPAFEGIADRFAELGFGADLTAAGFEELVKVINDGAAALVADMATITCGETADLVFDGVERSDALQDFGCYR